jgi:hypothetical protein
MWCSRSADDFHLDLFSGFWDEVFILTGMRIGTNRIL